jgi:pectate lyase
MPQRKSTGRLGRVIAALPLVSLLPVLLVGCPTSTPVGTTPNITNFAANPDTLPAGGGTTTLRWQVTGAQSLNVAPNVGTVSGESTMVTVPATTTYTLTAANTVGSRTATTTVTVQAAPPPPPNLVAFPGAEGFGATASGGRGGRVIYVTNLNANGPGSLQHALDQSGKRMIVFAVSGVVAGVPTTNGQDFTIAGQTSPGGIILRGLYLSEDPSCDRREDCEAGSPQPTPQNFIIRHLRIRPAPLNTPTSTADDALRLHRAKLGIIDHVSTGNAIDESMQISLSSDITVQYSLLSETVRDAGGDDHSEFGGMLLNYSEPGQGYAQDRISIHHNVFNRIRGRLPEWSRESAAATGTFQDSELSYNLYFDPEYPIAMYSTSVPNSNGINNYATNPIYYRLNIIGNLFFASAERFKTGMIAMEGGLPASERFLPDNTPTRIHMSGNEINLYPGLQDYKLIDCSCNDFADRVRENSMVFATTTPSFAQPTRHPFPNITATPLAQLRQTLAQQAGAFPRDPMDRRLMTAVAAGTISTAPRNTNPAGDALSFDWITPPPAPLDSDGDGMPDDWETANGLNPNLASDGTATTLSLAQLGVAGYTNVEVYLEKLAQQRMR